MRILSRLHLSRAVVEGEASWWPLRASNGRRWDFPHFAVGIDRQRRGIDGSLYRSTRWLFLPYGTHRYARKAVRTGR